MTPPPPPRLRNPWGFLEGRDKGREYDYPYGGRLGTYVLIWGLENLVNTG